jgi:putative peptidoglycan lipid II flippase
MATPGHQARQNAADGGVPPGTGFPPGDGVPAEEDPAYAPSDGSLDGDADGVTTQRYPAQHPPAQHPPAQHPPAQHPPAAPYPGYEADARYPSYRPDDGQYREPDGSQEAGGYPDTATEPYMHHPADQYPRYGPGGRGKHAAGPSQPPEPSWEPASPQPPETGWDPGTYQTQQPGWEPGSAQPQDAGWDSGTYQPQAQPPSWDQGTSQPQDAGWNSGTYQPQDAGWSQGTAQPRDTGWDRAAAQPGQEAGWEARGTRGYEPSLEDQETMTISLAPQGAWPVAPPWDPPTVRFAPIPAEGPSDTAAAATGANMLRSSGTMAVGTLVSRITGFVRTAILIYALGTGTLGDAYSLSNTLPNIVYQFALGGIFTSVVVPLLVNAAKRHFDRGQAYDQRVFTLGVLALGAVTVVATALAIPITAIYAGNIGSAPAYHLTEILAFFFIPQIFFYGVSSLAGAVLNARGSFASPMWTPVINNVVVILVGLLFIATAGLNRTPQDISGGEVVLLGVGTTLGIILQTVAMIPSLRRVGFRWRPRYDFRRGEVSEIGRMSGWMFGYVLTTQIAFLVTTRVANSGGAHAAHQAAGAGFAAYTYAYTLFQLPYAVIGISVITAMLPRMSSHASEGRYQRLAWDFSTATRLASVIVAPSALILAVLGGPLAEGLLGYGSTSAASARYVGEVFAVFSLGLLPYMLFQLLLRVFYALHDSRTPALIGLVTMTINIAANLIALAVLPPQHVVAGLGAGFGVANVIGTIIAWRAIGRRIGGLDGPVIRSSLLRMHAAAVPGALFAIAVSVMINAIIPGGRLAALFTVAVGGTGALLMYVIFAKAIGITELNDLIATVRARLR